MTVALQGVVVNAHSLRILANVNSASNAATKIVTAVCIRGGGCVDPLGRVSNLG